MPTIWLGIREALDARAGALDSSSPGMRMVVGGSAAPEQLIRDFDRLGMTLLHAWGMTETSPIGLVSRLPPELAAPTRRREYRAAREAGHAAAARRDLRVRNEAGDVPGDGKTSGELLVRGPWIAGGYVGGHDAGAVDRRRLLPHRRRRARSTSTASSSSPIASPT